MIIAVAFVLHVLIAYRLTRPTRGRGRRLGIAAFLTALFVVMALMPLSWRFPLTFIPDGWWPDVRVLGFLAMGAYSMIFTFFVLREVVWMGLRLADGVARIRDENTRILPEDPERRRLLAQGLNVGVLGAAASASTIAYEEARRRARVVEIDIPIKALPEALEGFTIVQLTDVHIGHTIRREYIQAIVDGTNELDADIVAITGDLIDGSVPDLTPDVEPLGDLRARHGVFFCTGNHEYYAGALEWITHLGTLGIRTLVNEHVVLSAGDASLMLAGVPDFSMGKYVDGHRPDPKKSRGEAHADVSVLLAHQPRAAFSAAKAGFDLQLSGHTHGGQFFPWNLVVQFIHPFVAGLERIGDMWIYVSRGTGYFGPPQRLGAPSEITRLKLVRAE